MTITIETAPVDDDGLLVHADDAIAQACLSVVRLESALAERGLLGTSILGIRLLTTPTTPAQDLVDVVTEELERLAVSPEVQIDRTAQLGRPGQLVALRAEVTLTPSTHRPIEGAPMSSPADLTALRRLRAVVTPDEAGYPDACLAWNRAAHLRPAAVATPKSIEEVVEVVRTATAAGLRIAPQSTGHNATALADVALDGALVLRLDEITGTTIDVEARTARVLGGTLWREVVSASAPYGLTALHGSAGDVAVAGYVLGGGLSFYGRRHGLACSTVRAFEVVTAEGDLVRASAAENTDLFWALRGGGGNFGVVVAIELELLPIGDVVAGMMLWDIEHAPAVLRTWAKWTQQAPESATTNFRIFRFPPIPELPPFLSGRSLAVIDGAVLEDDEEAARILAPLRDLEPEMDTFARIPAAGLLDVHMDPPEPTPAVSDHSMLHDLPDTAIEALLDVAGPGADTGVFFAELRHLGGALARPSEGALSHLDGRYALFAIAMAPTPEAQAAGEAATSAVVAALAPWATGGRYGNFTDRPSDASTMYGPSAWRSLTRLRETYDPHGVWVASHSIGPRPTTSASAR